MGGPESIEMSAEGVAAIGTFQGTVDFGKGGVASVSTSGRSDTFVIGFGP